MPSFWDVVGVALILVVLVMMLVGWNPFRRSRAEVPEHAVFVTIPLSDTEFGSPEERERLRGVMKDLDRAIQARNAGEFDGGDNFHRAVTQEVYPMIAASALSGKDVEYIARQFSKHSEPPQPRVS